MKKCARLFAGVVLVALIAVVASAFAGNKHVTYSTSNPAAIPTDGGTAGLELPTVNVLKPGRIKDVNVFVRGADERIGAVQLTLLPPRGPDVNVFEIDAVNIADNIGSGAFNCDGDLVKLDDSASTSIRDEDGDAAGAYKPASKLSALNGRSPVGKWRLLIGKPGANTDGGSIGCFQLKITTKSNIKND